MKISVIGAGHVGSTLAERIVSKGIGDVLLVDIVPGLAKAKAADISDAAPLLGYSGRIEGTTEFKDMQGSSIAVITAGLARRPGMSRDDLLLKNMDIVKGILGEIKEHSSAAIVLMVTNPLDVMTYMAYIELKCERGRVIGMAGNLDGARYRNVISEELGLPAGRIEASVLGSHGNTMVPILSRTIVNGKSLRSVAGEEQIDNIVRKTKERGGFIVGLLKSGSAYFSPSAACLEIIDSIANNKCGIIACSSVLKGEYGISDCAIGVPAKIGKNGIESIVEWELTENEISMLRKSAASVKETIGRYLTVK